MTTPPNARPDTELAAALREHENRCYTYEPGIDALLEAADRIEVLAGRVAELEAANAEAVGGSIMSAEPLIPFMVRMPPDLYAEVKAVAEAEDRSIAQTIRRAIRRYIDTAGGS